MIERSALALLCASLLNFVWLTDVQAYEADVHFGLTKWLAQKAGFEPFEADLIALGDQRVDSGTMDSINLALDYACGREEPAIAEKVQRVHFPSDDGRVAPGSVAARRPPDDLLGLARESSAQQLLLLFGASLHPLQDSWSHAGVPATPGANASLKCNATLMLGHPLPRGGPASHTADATNTNPVDIQPMAMATYEYLRRYPPLSGRQRHAARWEEIAPELDQFARASTKTEKRRWLLSHSIEDTNFLEGVSLPNGADPGPLKFSGRLLPELIGPVSTQWGIADDVRAFFDKVIERWLSADKIEIVVAELSGTKAPRPDLLARMKLWKMKDHGFVSSLAHASSPLSAKQLAAVENLTRSQTGYVRAQTARDAFLPVIAKSAGVSSLEPYVIRPLAPVGGAKRERFLAIARLKHAPYDTVGWIAEHAENGWTLVDMISVVDH